MAREPLAVLLSAVRTPIGTFGGAFKDVDAADLGAAASRRRSAARVSTASDVDDVIMGCVLQAGAGMNVARQVAVRAGVPVTVPAETVNRVCGSGLQAVVHGVEAIRGGYARAVLAGGTESMSRAPYILRGVRWGLRLGHGEVEDSVLAEGLSCALERCHMGMTAEEVARRYGVTRAEQDAFAAESQARAARALEAKAFADEIVAVTVPGPKKTTGRRRRATSIRGPARHVERLAALEAGL